MAGSCERVNATLGATKSEISRYLRKHYLLKGHSAA